MSLDERIANLIRIQALKPAARDSNKINQYLANAEGLRADAASVDSALSRFLLAYEGLHALAMAFLTNRGVRTAGEGHRSVALQLAVRELTTENVEASVQAMIRIHNARNETTYFEPVPPMSDQMANATLKLLDAALAGAREQIEI